MTWRFLVGADAVAPVGPDEPDDGGDDEDFDAEVEAVEGGFEAGVGVPGLAELHADPGEDKAPGPGSEEGIEMEAELRHAGDAGGQGDEGADDGQEASEEDGDAAVLAEEVLGAGEVVGIEEDEAAPAGDEGAAAVCADPVSDEGAEIAAEGAGGGDAE